LGRGICTAEEYESNPVADRSTYGTAGKERAVNPSLVKDKIVLSGTDDESILSTISKVLKFGNVVRFNVDARTEMVDFWRKPTDDEIEEELANPFRGVLKQVQMEEYVPEEDEGGERQFFSMCEVLEDAGCYPVFLLTGRPITELRKWIAFPRRSTHIAGVPILPNPDLSDDVVLLCGAKVKDAEPVDVSFILKMTLP